MRPFCVWCGQPETNLARPRLDSCRTPPCRPPAPGEHEEETAPTHEVNPPARTRRGGSRHGPDSRLLRRTGRPQEDRRRLRPPRRGRRASPREVRTSRTVTADLIALADWLDAEGVSH